MTKSESRPVLLRNAILLATVAFGVRAMAVGIYVRAYDHHEESPSIAAVTGAPTHAMIKGDAVKYYRGGAAIAEQIRAGENLFLAGSRHAGPVLYQRVVAAFALVTGKIQIGDDGRVPRGQILGFLLFQSLLFSVCLVPFFVQLAAVAGRPLAFGATALLGLEPTLVQYSAMMLTEALFMALGILALSVWFRICRRRGSLPTEEWGWLVLLGFMLGLMFLQRPQSILLPAVFIVGLLAQARWRFDGAFLQAAGLVVLPYVAVLALLGLHNQGRAGIFYIVPMQAAYGWQQYLGNRVIAEVNGTDPAHERERLGEQALDRAKTEGWVADHVDDVDDATERAERRVYEIYKEQAFEIFGDHPLIALRIATVETAGSLVLNLTWPFRFYSNTYKSALAEEERLRQVQRRRHKPATIIYSLLILVPAAAGWLLFREALPTPINIVLVLSIVYFTATGGWLGNPRYTLPNLLFYAAYWSAFVVSLGQRLAEPSELGGPPAQTVNTAR